MPNQDFVSPDKIQVIIPYSDLEKVVHMAHELEEMRKQFERIEEQYTAIRGMFSECLQKIREIDKMVQD